jgi:hypothetical protein
VIDAQPPRMAAPARAAAKNTFLIDRPSGAEL